MGQRVSLSDGGVVVDQAGNVVELDPLPASANIALAETTVTDEDVEAREAITAILALLVERGFMDAPPEEE